VALKNLPEESPEVPEGVLAARINPDTGLRDPEGRSGILEYFYHENLPPEGEPMPETGAGPASGRKPEDLKKITLFAPVPESELKSIAARAADVRLLAARMVSTTTFGLAKRKAAR
jgi:hypothetical protein